MRKILLAATVVLLVAAGCGGDDDGSGSGSASGSASGSGSGTEETTTTAAADEAPVTLEGDVENHGSEEVSGGEVDLEADDFYFGPTFLQVGEGGTVTVHLTNEGSATHTFTIDALDVDEEVPAGESADIEVELPDSGATAFYCRFHQGQGMQGAFFFEAGDTVNS